MSRIGEILYNPMNGLPEETWDGFSWPAFFFGVIWLLVKGLWGHFVISLVLLVVSVGFLAPVIWIVYGFVGNEAHKNSLLKKGYLTLSQHQERMDRSAPAPAPATFAPAPALRNPIEQLKELASMREKGFLTEDEFNDQKAKLLAS